MLVQKEDDDDGEKAIVLVPEEADDSAMQVCLCRQPYAGRNQTIVIVQQEDDAMRSHWAGAERRRSRCKIIGHAHGQDDVDAKKLCFRAKTTIVTPNYCTYAGRGVGGCKTAVLVQKDGDVDCKSSVRVQSESNLLQNQCDCAEEEDANVKRLYLRMTRTMLMRSYCVCAEIGV